MLIGVVVSSAFMTAAVNTAADAVPPSPALVIRLAVFPEMVRPIVHHTKKVKTAPTKRATRPRMTPSLYERTTAQPVLRAQGCRAGEARTNGIVVLDFGKPNYAYGRYGTITFANRIVSNEAITAALKAYAHAYVRCLPKNATSRITLVRGTSNYNLRTVPSTYVAGRLWARETASFARYLREHEKLGRHVSGAAGDDAEPAWDRTFKRTFNFFRGFRSASHGQLLYNFGSLDGGPGGIWNVRQAYYVAAGMRYVRPLPEIYNKAMAEEWALLSRIGVERYGKPLAFAGLMTQHTTSCRRCGYTSAQAHKALVHELAKSPRTRVRMLAAVTNIGSRASYGHQRPR